MSSTDSHPKSGVFAVIISGVALIMLLIALPLGMTQSGERGFSTFLGFVSLSVAFAFVGIISSLIGLRSSRKLLPAIGLLMGGIFFVIIIVVLISTNK